MDLNRIFEQVLCEAEGSGDIHDTVRERLLQGQTVTIMIKDNPYDEFILTPNKSKTKIRIENTYQDEEGKFVIDMNHLGEFLYGDLENEELYIKE